MKTSNLALTHSVIGPWEILCDFENVIFNLALLIDIFKSSYDNVLRWMPQNLTDDKSTLVQVMAWCRQATSHYLNQCWPRSPMPYGVTRPQWVKTLWIRQIWNPTWWWHSRGSHLNLRHCWCSWSLGNDAGEIHNSHMRAFRHGLELNCATCLSIANTLELPILLWAWTCFLLVIINCIIVVVVWCAGRGSSGASHNASLHIDSLSFDDVITLLTVFEMLLCSVF